MSTFELPEEVQNLFPASPLNHVLVIQKFPFLTYHVQEFDLPAISVEPVITNSPRLALNLVPTRPKFDPLTVKFIVDEEFLTYKELYNWITGITDTNEREPVADFLAKQASKWGGPFVSSVQIVTSTIGLTILNANKTPILRIAFINAQPKHLSAISFSTKETELTPITASATFAYDYYTITDLR